MVSYRHAAEPVLTVRQPWASLIVNGMKTVENRTWVTDYRGRLWIHASAAKVDNVPDFRELAASEPRGVILGSVQLVDIVTDAKSRWATPGECHWLLARATRLEVPIPATGRLGLWPLPGKSEA
jgi:ASCH domain